MYQLDGVLPRLNYKEERKSATTAKYSIKTALTCVCRQMYEKNKIEMFRVPTTVIIVHGFNSETNRVFDMDNREKSVIINSLKGYLFKDDTLNDISYFTEIAKEVSYSPKTMVFVAAAKLHLFLLSEIVPTFFDMGIEAAVDVFTSNIITPSSTFLSWDNTESAENEKHELPKTTIFL